MDGVTNNKKDESGAADCIFCSIAAKKTSAEIVYESDNAVFFHDISPKAAVHVVGIPKKHVVSLSKMVEEDKALMGVLLYEAALAADKLGLCDDGYRVITNVGSNAGQDVKHFHWHILGGESLGSLRC